MRGSALSKYRRIPSISSCYSGFIWGWVVVGRQESPQAYVRGCASDKQTRYNVTCVHTQTYIYIHLQTPQTNTRLVALELQRAGALLLALGLEELLQHRGRRRGAGQRHQLRGVAVRGRGVVIDDVFVCVGVVRLGGWGDWGEGWGCGGGGCTRNMCIPTLPTSIPQYMYIRIYTHTYVCFNNKNKNKKKQRTA